jgi:hypothetical protein
MPITQERQNIEDFRKAGFPQEQANVLAAKIEDSAQAIQQDLKSFISGEIDRLRKDMELHFAQMEARSEHAMRIQLGTILGAFVGLLGLAVAIIKLLP